MSNETSSSHYRPQQLLLALVPSDPLSSEEQLAPELALIGELLDVHLLSTRVTATEKGHGHLINDQQQNYTQEFYFVERRDKTIYNAFREARATGLEFGLLMYEPSEDRRRVVDAWLLVAKIAEVRCSAYAVRNLARVEDPDAPPINTTVRLAGTLHHELSLIQQAQAKYDTHRVTGEAFRRAGSAAKMVEPDDRPSHGEFLATNGKGLDPDRFL